MIFLKEKMSRFLARGRTALRKLETAESSNGSGTQIGFYFQFCADMMTMGKTQLLWALISLAIK